MRTVLPQFCNVIVGAQQSSVSAVPLSMISVPHIQQQPRSRAVSS